jgi:tetratricopeptide (TPR) repeat protein
MAEIYSTFEVTGSQSVRIGKPIAHHLHLLARQPLMPLKDLFAVAHDSPDYNEREHQGIFYAESWLLTHYLMLGRNGANKASFGQLTALLRQGETPAQAFTNALRTPLPAMENQLRRYIEGGKFDVQPLSMRADLYASRAFSTRGLAPVEVCVRLGDQLMRVGRPEAAETYFVRGEKMAPRSPLPFEGLGILAASRGQHAEAVRDLNEALHRGSVSFLAHYAYAREKYQLTANGSDRYSAIGPEPASEIRAELQKSLGLMPDFGPAHRLLGFFEMAQGENLPAAEQHLQRAIQLEPENLSYHLSLAQAQLRRNEIEAARRTLEPLRLPYVEAQLRAHAEEILREIGKHEGKAP